MKRPFGRGPNFPILRGRTQSPWLFSPRIHPSWVPILQVAFLRPCSNCDPTGLVARLQMHRTVLRCESTKVRSLDKAQLPSGRSRILDYLYNVRKYTFYIFILVLVVLVHSTQSVFRLFSSFKKRLNAAFMV